MPVKPKVKAQNLRRGIEPLGGDLIRVLNEYGKEKGAGSIGTELNRRFAILADRVDAQAGHKGGVVIAKQSRKKSDVLGRPPHGIKLQGDRIGGAAFAIEDDDLPTWGQVRGYLDCKWFVQMLADCAEEEEIAAAITGGSIPWFWTQTINMPSDQDSVFNDPGAFFAHGALGGFVDLSQSWFYTWSFVLPESCSPNFISWYFGSDPFVTVSGEVTQMNVGLYDANRNLVWQLNPFDITPYDVGGVVVKQPTGGLTLPSGEYHLAYFSPLCHQIYSYDTDYNSLWLMNGGLGVLGDPNEPDVLRSGWAWQLEDPRDPAFPATLPSTPYFDDVTTILIPFFFFSET